MREVLKTAASLSLSGSLAVLVLLVLRPLWRERASKRWQYYVWLIAVFRLLLPLSLGDSPVGMLFQAEEAPPAAPFVEPYRTATAPLETGAAAGPSAPPEVPAASQPVPGAAGIRVPDWEEALALLWLGGTLVLLAWKLTGYQNFLRCLRAGCRTVDGPALLDLLARTGEELGVRRPVELYENPLAASPMLLGLFRPRIVLPTAAVPEGDFRHMVLHELAHYRRGDPLYKWLVQLTVCLHWWNPLVWVMAREIDRACELACDEAVLRALKPEERRAYGDTLLRALESGGGYRAAPGAVSLGENAELLKERLTAIMNFKRPSRWTALLSLALAAALTTGAAAAGAYTGPAKRDASAGKEKDLLAASASVGASGSVSSGTLSRWSALLAERSYEEGDVAAFSTAVPFLSREEQAAFLERAYEDGSSAFFSVLVNHLDWDEATLDAWTARAAKENAALCSILLKALDRDGELEALEKELEAKQVEEYKAAGITREGGGYYYQGKLVRVFLDLRFDASCVTLEMNPGGVLDIKVERDADGGIQSVRNLDAVEVAELFGDLNDPEEEPGGISITIPVEETWMRGGSWMHLGEYLLSEGDRIQYDVTAETGERMTVCFGDMEHSPEDVTYYSVSSKRADGELRCAADFVFDGAAVKPGAYRLFLHAPEGDLGNLTGSITLALKRGNPPDLAASLDARAMEVEDLPTAAREAMDQCAIRTWYVIHSEGRQYLYCNGFPWRYAWRPAWEDGAWEVNIRQLKKLDSGCLLLSFPDNAPLNVTLEGETVPLADIRA
ncbi:MAG: hypothetical protein HFF97_08680 [Oscillibacter sp.]|jgi:beta-lactamase regulating signal transducer with metallopeptidase domain|nr:hypothetical protein [Oscillibacter sp.]